MTFAQLQTEFTSRSDDTIDTVDIKTWLNLANQRVYSKPFNWPFLITTDTSNTTVAATADYSLPTDVKKIINVWVGTTKYGRIDEMDKLSSGLSQVYSINTTAGTITLFPTPTDSGETITINYEKVVPEFSDSSDEPLYDKSFHELPLYGALERYHEREKEMSKAAFYRAQFDNLLTDMFDFYSRVSADDVWQMQSLAKQQGLDY